MHCLTPSDQFESDARASANFGKKTLYEQCPSKVQETNPNKAVLMQPSFMGKKSSATS